MEEAWGEMQGYLRHRRQSLKLSQLSETLDVAPLSLQISRLQHDGVIGESLRTSQDQTSSQRLIKCCEEKVSSSEHSLVE